MIGKIDKKKEELLERKISEKKQLSPTLIWVAR